MKIAINRFLIGFALSTSIVSPVAAAAGRPPVPSLQIQSVKPEYVAFHSWLVQHPKANDQELFLAFDKMLVAPHSELFDRAIFGNRKPDETLRQRVTPRLRALAAYLHDQPKVHDLIMKQFDDFATTTATQVDRFRTVFSDFNPLPIKYVAAVSLLGMNGGSRTLGDSSALVFGIDSIVNRQDPLALLFSHELFHVYHAQSTPRMQADSRDEPFLRMLFWEGLAVHASGQLNPAEKDLRYFDEELRTWCESGAYKTHIKMFQDDLARADQAARVVNEQSRAQKSTSDKAAKERAQQVIEKEFSTWVDLERKWFLNDVKPVDMPYRAAYCLGDKAVEYLVARDGARLADMPRWDHREMKARMTKALKEMAR